MSKLARLGVAGFAVVLVLQAVAAGDTGLARHKKLYAVPVPGKVVVDGKLDDWDLSGQIFMYVVSETSDMQSARFALMYDAEALYLSGVVRDPTPMMNRHDPKVDPDKGWDADACQFRIVLDAKQGYPVNQSSFQPVANDQMAHLTLWYYTDRKEPVLQLLYGMKYAPPQTAYPTATVAPADRFQAAYVAVEDGRGYTFEYRVPWKTLEAKTPPKAGDVVAGTVQFCWSAPDGLKTAGGAAWAYDVMSGPGFSFQTSGVWGKIIFAEKGHLPKEMVEDGLPPEKPLPLTFAYSVPEDGEVSVALFDEAGWAVRTLVAQGARRAGQNVERWDGLDNAGKPLRPGKYAWKGLYHQPVKTKFILSAHNSGTPPYKTDDNTGGWGGDHGCPTAVCSAGDGVFLTWNMSESGWGIIRTDLNGKKVWGIKHNAEDIATDGQRLFVVGDHGFEGEHSVKLFDAKDGRPLNWGNGKPFLAPPAGATDTNSNVAAAVACGGGKAYVSWTTRGMRIYVGNLSYSTTEDGLRAAFSRYGEVEEASLMIDPETHRSRGMGFVTMPRNNEAHAAITAWNGQPLDGYTLFVRETGAKAGGGVVGVYDAASGELKAAWPVPAPRRLAVLADGALAVITQGHVTVLRDGKLAPLPLIANHVDDPRSLAVATDGTIYVANAGKLQDISVFSADGKYVRSIGKSGGRPRVGRYDAGGILEPGGIALDSLGHLWVAETLDSPKRHSVWNAGTGEFVREFFGGSSYFGWASMDPKHADELYCHNVLWKVDLTKGTCVPHSTIWRGTAPNMIQSPNPGGYAGHFRVITARSGKQFGWGMVDYSNMLYLRDGDVFKPVAGTIRIAFGPYGGGVLYPVMKGMKEGAYLWQDGNNDQTVQENELVRSPVGRGEGAFNWIDADLNCWCDGGVMFRPVRFEADGRPVYDFSKAEPLPAPFKGANSNCTSLWLDEQDDTVYTLAPGQEPGFASWTRQGKMIWGYGGIVDWNKALSLPMVAPGRLWGLTMPLGLAGEFTGAACYFGPYHIFTRDGLYVAMVMRDGRSGGLGADITASETLTGQLVKPDGTNRYFLLAGDQDGRVTEILGLDTVKRLPGGTYEYTAANAADAAAALAEYERAKARGQRLDIVRGKSGLAAAKGVGKVVDAARSFTARAAYDDKNLYVAFDVTSPCELVNQAGDPRLIFKGGNLLDIQLATDPAADAKRKAPAPGDLRILVTRQQALGAPERGKCVAVVFRPRVAGFQGQRIVLTSPTGKESFDAIDTTDRLALEYTKSAGGFQAVLAVPLELIGWSPKPGAGLRMDVGYIFGNAAGTQASMRAYWMNNSFSANVTNDVPNETRLEPAEWGAATVE